VLHQKLERVLPLLPPAHRVHNPHAVMV
jgi:hypothetical protein